MSCTYRYGSGPDPCGPFVWGNTMCCNVVPLGRLRAAGVCGPYKVMKK